MGRRWTQFAHERTMVFRTFYISRPPLRTPSPSAAGLWDWVLHLDVYLDRLVQTHGRSVYGILFAIVFAETGLVICPFLPGDSLLFSTAALAAAGRLSIAALALVFVAAAVLGDGVNYLGAWLRMWVALVGALVWSVCAGAVYAIQSLSVAGALPSS